MTYTPRNRMLLAALDEYVTGHTTAKKALILMLNRSRLRTYQKYVKNMDMENLVSPLKILLIGKSGTGKSHLLHSLQQIDTFPLVKLDATHLNPTGASGGVKPEKLEKMIMETAQAHCQAFPTEFPYLEYAIEQTIVFVDEFDKLGTSFEGSGNWNKHVQSSFLTLFDHKDDFAGVSFVFAGAFDTITNNKTVSKNIGFQHNNIDMVTSELEDKVVASGLIPEIVGRMNSIIELDIFTKENYISIINERILPKKAKDLAAIGLFNVGLTTKEIEILATRAVKSGQGVRFLQREIENLYLDLEFNSDEHQFLLDNDNGEYE